VVSLYCYCFVCVLKGLDGIGSAAAIRVYTVWCLAANGMDQNGGDVTTRTWALHRGARLIFTAFPEIAVEVCTAPASFLSNRLLVLFRRACRAPTRVVHNWQELGKAARAVLEPVLTGTVAPIELVEVRYRLRLCLVSHRYPGLPPTCCASVTHVTDTPSRRPPRARRSCGPIRWRPSLGRGARPRQASTRRSRYHGNGKQYRACRGLDFDPSPPLPSRAAMQLPALAQLGPEHFHQWNRSSFSVSEAQKALTRTFGRLVRLMVDVTNGTMRDMEHGVWKRSGSAEAPGYCSDVCPSPALACLCDRWLTAVFPRGRAHQCALQARLMQRMAETCGALLGDAWGWLRVAMDALETKVRTGQQDCLGLPCRCTPL
jgi:hypothetical protein